MSDLLDPTFKSESLKAPGVLIPCDDLWSCVDSDDCVVASTPLKDISYGELFAYMFRRFGTPNLREAFSAGGHPRLAEWVDRTLALRKGDMVLGRIVGHLMTLASESESAIQTAAVQR